MTTKKQSIEDVARRVRDNGFATDGEAKRLSRYVLDKEREAQARRRVKTGRQGKTRLL